MKRMSILFVIAWTLIVGGCADPLEQRSAEEVGGQLQRGVTGQGTLGPVERPSGDTAAEHSVQKTLPKNVRTVATPAHPKFLVPISVRSTRRSSAAACGS